MGDRLSEERTPYREILGSAFDALDPKVRLAHSAPLAADGDFDVEHGTQPLTRPLVVLLRLPAAGRGVPVVLHVRIEASRANAGRRTMHWERRIGATPLFTRQHAHRGLLVERCGPGALRFALHVEDGGLRYEQVSFRALGVPLPPFIAPHVRARVSPDANGWRVDVVVEWRGRLVCRYGGTMRPRETSS